MEVAQQIEEHTAEYKILCKRIAVGIQKILVESDLYKKKQLIGWLDELDRRATMVWFKIKKLDPTHTYLLKDGF